MFYASGLDFVVNILKFIECELIHHQLILKTWISLILSHHSSLSSIALGRSSR